MNQHDTGSVVMLPSLFTALLLHILLEMVKLVCAELSNSRICESHFIGTTCFHLTMIFSQKMSLMILVDS
ncbi:hypothetical protein DIPPA_21156 [Diplonema papillatum]|nr:hypothetical protein DIPPA_21156 [Diplonema papillatum]